MTSVTRSGAISWSRSWAREKLAAGEALNPATLTKITQRLGELQGPRILSEVIIDPGVFTSTKEQLLEATKGFRIFGQRFTFDAWIFSRLTAGQEQTPLRLPSMPSALFVPAALGDKTARELYGPVPAAPLSPLHS